MLLIVDPSILSFQLVLSVLSVSGDQLSI
jgi:hypothetical protein